MLYIKTPSPLQKSTKEQKMIENSQFLTKSSYNEVYIHFKSVFILNEVQHFKL